MSRWKPLAAKCVASLAFLLVLAGCSANPVTGERELVLFSTEFEVETGRSHFGPAQQAEGGLYTADPEVARYVSSVGQRVAAVSDRRLPYEFVVLNSSIPNAWALPGGKIAVNRGLLMEMENEAELAAVLGHEIVHAAARHGAQAMNRDVLFQVAVLAAQAGGLQGERAGQMVGAGAVAFGLINRGYSREAEREADYHGMRYMHSAGYDTGAAISLQEKFLRLSNGRDQGWLLGLLATHPPSAERVQNNRAALAEFPPGGMVGREPYADRLAGLLAARAAYDAADEARRMLSTRPARSLQEIREAIALEPREAMFHGIRGQALARENRLGEAIAAYSTAIALGAPYWEHYLGRGLAHEVLGDRFRAKSDLGRSLGLLQTAIGHLALGTLLLEDGDRSEAKRHFAAARQADSAIGAAAEREYLLLDITDAPGRHVKVEPSFDNGRVLVRVANRTDIALEEVWVRLDVAFNGQPPIRRWVQYRSLGPRRSAVADGRISYGEEDSLEAWARVEEAHPDIARRSPARPYPPYP